MSAKDRIVREALDVAREDLVGASEWKRSKLSWLTGAGVARSAVGGLSRQVGEARRVCGFLARAAFRADTAQALPTESRDAAERFEVARRVYGRSEGDLVSMQSATHRAFLLYLFLFVCVLAFGIASFGLYETVLPGPIDALSRFSMLPPLLALAARHGFYNWQIRTRRLGSVRGWLSSPGEWWSAPPEGARPPGGGRGAALGALALAASIACASAPALAQTAPAAFTIPPQTDLWVKLLQQVLPGIGPLQGGTTGSSQAIATAFGAFLAVLMALAAAYMAFAIAYGLVATAHEGKVMGQRWHQIWAPIRVVAGIGMLTPVIKGYCIAQILVVYLAVWGGSIGNVVWAAYVDSLAMPTFDAPNLPQTMDLARDTTKLEACWASVAISRQMAAAASGGGNVAPLPASGQYVPPNHPTRTQTWSVQDMSVATMGDPLAGAAMMAFTRPPPGSKQDVTWDYGACGRISGVFAMGGQTVPYDNQVVNSFEAFRASAAAAGLLLGQSVAADRQVTQEQIDAAVRDVIAAKQRLDEALVADARAFLGASNQATLNAFVNSAKQAGWVSGGSYYVTVSRVQAQLLQQINNLPAVQFGSPKKITNADVATILFGTRDGAQSNGTGVLERFDATWAAQASGGMGALSAQSAVAGQDPNEGWSLQAVMNWLFIKTGLTKLVLDTFSTTPGQGGVLQHMMNFGHAILNVFWVLLALMMIPKSAGALSAIGKGLANAPFLGGILSGLGSFLFMLCIGLLAVGVVHAYVLPLVPYVLFLFFVMGMLVLTVEGVIAACLFAFVHVRMDGADLVDQAQKPGYMIMFNMLLRIPLAMFGLFLSIAVFEALISLMSVTFYPAVVSVMSANASGLIGVFVMLVVMTYLHYQIAMRSFHLITQVPDRVSRWFGSSAEQLGEESHAGEANRFLVGEVKNTVNNQVARGMGVGRMGLRNPAMPGRGLPGAGGGAGQGGQNLLEKSAAARLPNPRGGRD